MTKKQQIVKQKLEETLKLNKGKTIIVAILVPTIEDVKFILKEFPEITQSIIVSNINE